MQIFISPHNRFADVIGPNTATVMVVDPQVSISEGIAAAAGAAEVARLSNNLIGLVRSAKAFGLDVTVTARTDQGELLPELSRIVDQCAVHTRIIGDALDDQATDAAVRTGARRIVFLALWGRDESVVSTALRLKDLGQDVRLVIDASWPNRDVAGHFGIATLTAAGIDVVSWVTLLTALSHDAGPERLPPAARDVIRENLSCYAPVSETSWMVPAVSTPLPIS